MTTTLTPATTDSNLQRLTEHVRDWRSGDLLVDTTRRIVRNVALTGLKSKNGYRYTEQALRRAVPLYEDRPVFLDHAANLSKPHERSTRDLVGAIINPRFENGRLRGDVQTLDTEAGRTFLALAEGENPAVGMSHVVLAERSAGGSVVETIRDVVSVDAVVFPATTSTLRESADPPSEAAAARPGDSTPLGPSVSPSRPWPGSVEALLSRIDALVETELPGRLGRSAAATDAPAVRVRRAGLFSDSVLVEVRDTDESEPQYVSIRWTLESGCLQLSGEANPVDPTEFVHEHRHEEPIVAALRKPVVDSEREQITAERDELLREVERLESERDAVENERAVERLLADSRLPDYAVTDLLRGQLLAADDETRLALLSERRDLLKRLRVHRPSSRERAEPHSESHDAAIVAAIRRQGAGRW